jgi:hypothetical protein
MDLPNDADQLVVTAMTGSTKDSGVKGETAALLCRTQLLNPLPWVYLISNLAPS